MALIKQYAPKANIVGSGKAAIDPSDDLDKRVFRHDGTVETYLRADKVRATDKPFLSRNGGLVTPGSGLAISLADENFNDLDVFDLSSMGAATPFRCAEVMPTSFTVLCPVRVTSLSGNDFLFTGSENFYCQVQATTGVIRTLTRFSGGSEGYVASSVSLAVGVTDFIWVSYDDSDQRVRVGRTADEVLSTYVHEEAHAPDENAEFRPFGASLNPLPCLTPGALLLSSAFDPAATSWENRRTARDITAFRALIGL